MDRRLLFPAVVATAWAQQTSPAAAAAEKALRARAEQFYQLEVEKKFRQAEAFVAEDTKDLYYGNSKPDIRKFSISKVDVSPDGQSATLTVMITSVMRVPNMPETEFSAPVAMTWKLDHGEWAWYQIQNGEIDTPFGKWRVSPSVKGEAPSLPLGMVDPSKIRSLVTIDRTEVALTPGSQKTETVTITNHMAGDISLKILDPRPQDLVVTVPKETLHAGESAGVSFSAPVGSNPTGTVSISAGPAQNFSIQIRTK